MKVEVGRHQEKLNLTQRSAYTGRLLSLLLLSVHPPILHLGEPASWQGVGCARDHPSHISGPHRSPSCPVQVFKPGWVPQHCGGRRFLALQPDPVSPRPAGCCCAHARSFAPWSGSPSTFWEPWPGSSPPPTRCPCRQWRGRWWPACCSRAGGRWRCWRTRPSISWERQSRSWARRVKRVGKKCWAHLPGAIPGQG